MMFYQSISRIALHFVPCSPKVTYLTYIIQSSYGSLEVLSRLSLGVNLKMLELNISLS